MKTKFLSKYHLYPKSRAEEFVSKMNSGILPNKSDEVTPPPVYGSSFFGQEKRAAGSTPELETILTELESFATYDPLKGGFVMSKWVRYDFPVGSPIGKILPSTQYIQVTLKRYPRPFWEHRLVWLWHTGSWPTQIIDHIDQNPSNNRIENLRDVSPMLNAKNRRLNYNRVGLMGVRWIRQTNKWCSAVTHAGFTYMSYFDTREEAIAYREKIITEHPEFGFTELHGSTKRIKLSNEVKPNNVKYVKPLPSNPFLKIVL